MCGCFFFCFFFCQIKLNKKKNKPRTLVLWPSRQACTPNRQKIQRLWARYVTSEKSFCQHLRTWRGVRVNVNTRHPLHNLMSIRVPLEPYRCTYSTSAVSTLCRGMACLYRGSGGIGNVCHRDSFAGFSTAGNLCVRSKISFNRIG